ncbi:hypothetical protein TNIN_465661 [Trichonephila inaurata madagascariensis]|uniref:Uncharacterized protein n=1 Tax=Trichonephila inaurata madagascariensis TaxID=2747483 RepID=A0A8X6I4L0_9ARAC|nr:hypothetical protein TNIN_465661 [Trichonephila inaurata madagascariensis]
MERPIARGADPFTSRRFPSHTPNTVNTSTNVIKNSTAVPWTGVTFGWRAVIPKVVFKSSGVTDLSTAAPAIPPAHCITTYSMARVWEAHTIIPVTAGLFGASPKNDRWIGP